ncbi:5362_t:CDS:2 [Paraglomus brasilianum]|uniref:5362_t:CDS:1 n=1 Tax=Paraglomus brasilianum TaxID=144538 RepID=A0A9N8VU30_9GLOM|nr:5362_t:CDS:2 [Paraglomus brasilianum]
MSTEAMDIDESPNSSKTTQKKEKEGKRRFEVKKWNAVALWAWGTFHAVFVKVLTTADKSPICVLASFLYIDIVVDNCAICRNHIMDLCKN